jgi:histidyl-tRNA synthetase
MIQKPKGTLDILPGDSGKWQYVEQIIRDICKLYGYGEIRLPTFEATELFARGVGDTTDVVQKEMYTFTVPQDKDKKSFTLRPEGTANTMRSVIENSLHSGALPLKLYYIMTCFRYEQPQAGRSREYYTFGIEQIGSASPIVDGEVISLADALLKKLGIGDVALHINSIGCMNDGCRPEYHRILKEYLTGSYDSLCETCKSRFERNPTRVLDCKSDICKNIVASAPKSKDYLCGECRDHFGKLQVYLKTLGIDFIVNPLIVRGLDYYTKTVFEFISDNIGALGTIIGGGRYDGLSELIGGPKMPGIGFGMGIGRLIEALKNSGGYFPESEVPLIYIAALADDKARETAIGLVRQLRDNNIYAETDNMERSLKSQMKYADKIGAEYVYIIGGSEVAERKAVLKNMRTSEQSECRFDELLERLEGERKV